jgi:hypothetical protein
MQLSSLGWHIVKTVTTFQTQQTVTLFTGYIRSLYHFNGRLLVSLKANFILHLEYYRLQRTIKTMHDKDKKQSHRGKRRYSSYSFITSALDGGEWSASRPGRALAPGNGPPVPIVQEAGWATDTEARGKILCPCRGSNLDRPVVQSIARHYTDWATPAPQEKDRKYQNWG